MVFLPNQFAVVWVFPMSFIVISSRIYMIWKVNYGEIYFNALYQKGAYGAFL